MPKRIDLTGRRFGRWVVLNYSHTANKKHTMWLCLCDCGNTGLVATTNLLRGKSISCGCYRNELLVDRVRTHGDSGSNSRLYITYCSMKQRCYNENTSSYKYYGARGIRVCDEWLKDYMVFREWAYASGYADTLTIERLDNDGDYCPENCTWIPQNEQSKHRRSVLMYEDQPLCDLARTRGLNPNMVRDRLYKGWTVEEALGLVPRKRKSARNKGKKFTKQTTETASE